MIFRLSIFVTPKKFFDKSLSHKDIEINYFLHCWNKEYEKFYQERMKILGSLIAKTNG